jgi:putative ATP-grasp target RiPP
MATATPFGLTLALPLPDELEMPTVYDAQIQANRYADGRVVALDDLASGAMATKTTWDTPQRDHKNDD